MNRVYIKFKDPERAPDTFYNAKSCTFEPGWVHIVDQNDGTTSLPSDTIASVEKTPVRY